MCRVEERVYVEADGRRRTFEDAFPCDKAHRGRLCSNVQRRTTEYYPKQPPPISRDDAPSPASNNPPTPTGTGSYLVEHRRPSGVTRRPSTRDGQRVIKPEIKIEFGARKDKTKKYPHISVPSKTYKRSSLGAASVTSNEVAIESPGSDASYTVRTGFPEAPVPPSDLFGQPQGYTTRAAVPQGHHRHTSSASSFTTSSQPPSLYAASEPESPSGRRPARYPPTIVHNPPPGVAPSSPIASHGNAATSSSPYRTKIAVPHGSQSSSRDNLGADGLTPLDYSDFVDHSTSSRASSSRPAAPEITERGADRERRRKQKEDERRRQEESDRRLAEDIAKEETKQVRFELGRAEDRARQRGENKLAESEKRRAVEREEARRRKAKEREEQAAREARKEKTNPAPRDYNKRPEHRRLSMSRAAINERKRLLAETEVQMAREREATEKREREERAALLRQQQQTNEYWDPRGGDRYPVANKGPGIGRRGSVSGDRRGSVSNAPPVSLGRTSSTRRVSIIQDNPPSSLSPLNTSFPQQQQYSTRPPSSHHPVPPPPFSLGSGTTYARPPSARHSSYHQDNPFAQPPTRGPHASHENPFAHPPSALHSPSATVHDQWDTRNMREALPRSTSHRDQPHTLSRRGEDYIGRGTAEDSSRGHSRAQQATRNMGKAVGYGDYESEYEE